MDVLQNEIKTLIIESLNLEGMTPDEIDTAAPLFGEGLGLDSIDALELGLAIKNRYGVVLSAESEDTKKHFYSVASLAELVNSQRGK
ncbi:phosphopantetheine-binding protein [Budvicia diplopodorum]|uniref:phosphopantetheine-binding protein n=1 Tax=Budvicia diplopodorum TaxID=1119056 RepID=UPI00135A5F6A|nr:phosphopantetheine-binding protein [Budvicia diplopodorum]